MHDYILASEISEYVACKHGWQLLIEGKLDKSAPEELEMEAENDETFLQMQAVRIKKYAAWFFLLVGIGIMLGIIYVSF